MIHGAVIFDHISAFWDVLPMLYEVAGASVPKGIDGISMAPILTGNSQRQKKHEYLYWEFPAYSGQQAVRMGDWKGIRQNMFRAKNGGFRTELYNLRTDIRDAEKKEDRNIGGQKYERRKNNRCCLSFRPGRLWA